MQLFPSLNKVVFLDDDVVVQHDLSPLWDIDLSGKVNGAVETCRGGDSWVMSKRFRNYLNFSHPLIAKNFDPSECGDKEVMFCFKNVHLILVLLSAKYNCLYKI